MASRLTKLPSAPLLHLSALFRQLLGASAGCSHVLLKLPSLCLLSLLDGRSNDTKSDHGPIRRSLVPARAHPSSSMQTARIICTILH